MSNCQSFENNSLLKKRKFDDYEQLEASNNLFLELDNSQSIFEQEENNWNIFSQSNISEEEIFCSKPTQDHSIHISNDSSDVWDLTEAAEWNQHIENQLNNCSYIPSQVETSYPSLSQNTENLCQVVAPENNSTEQTLIQSPITVKFELASKFEKLWYSGRPFPAFTLQLVNSLDGNLIRVNGWKVMVSVYDGFGNPAGDKVCDVIQNHLYEVHDGCVSILGLRFLAVSSKAGGHYTLAINLVSSSPSEISQTSIPFISEKIQVLSYRLFLVPKVENDALRPQDAISKMKGIGHLTTKRFAELGIKTILQLAALDTEYMGDQGCGLLLNHLRKNRGSLTRPKLFEYIAMAREIVDRNPTIPSSPSDQSSPSCFSTCSDTYEVASPPTKRQCTSSLAHEISNLDVESNIF